MVPDFNQKVACPSDESRCSHVAVQWAVVMSRGIVVVAVDVAVSPATGKAAP